MTFEPRSAYKSVWDALSSTNTQAIAHVIGEVDEPAIELAASQTKYWLEVSVGINPDDVILEIGCGIGRVGQILAPLCKEWIGCDVSSNMLEHTRQRLAQYTNVRLVELNGYDLRPIADSSIDLVYCTVVFMHLEEWDRYNYVLEACRVLRPGGRLFVDNFNLCSDAGWQIFEMHRQLPPQQRPPHMSRGSTPPEIAAYFQRSGGFEQIQVREQGAWIQAYGIRSAHAPPKQALMFEPMVEQKKPGQQLAEYEQEIQRLHTAVAIKNAHIQQLEQLLTRIQNGRMLRLLRLIGR